MLLQQRLIADPEVSAIPSLELVMAERPARMRHPVAALEVDRVELGAAAAPDRGGAAEEAEA